MNKKILFLLVNLLLFNCLQISAQTEPELYGNNIFFHDWNQTNHTKDGYDWSMPNWVEPAENSGIVSSRKIGAFDFKRKDEIYNERGYRGQFKRRVGWNWKRLEPREGTYDFQGLRDEIASVSENGKYKIELTIYAAVFRLEFLNTDGTVDTSLNNFQIRAIDTEQSAPRWLVDTYNIPRMAPAIEGNVRITNLDEFNPAYHSRYLKLIEALGESGILNNPLIQNAYVCLGSPTRGEEGEGPQPGEANYAKYLERLDAWSEAAGSNAKKLTSVASNTNNVQEGINRGMGQRSGFVEQYLIRLTNSQIGTGVNAQGYLEYNEDATIYKENRASGDENENYFIDQLAISRFGEPRSYKHRYRESTLRALQMRRTGLWDEWAEGFVNPPLSQFAALSLAKKVNTTADAWCYLRQSNMNQFNPNNQGLKNSIAPGSVNPDGTLPVKNFERWLYQRDGDDVKTVPTLERGQGGDILFRAPAYPFDYTARRTDRNNGFSKIGFALDDRFASGNNTNVAIKVSYLDRGNNTWYLSYKNKNGEEVRKNVTNSNANIIKTTTWIINDISLDATGLNNDFYLVATQGDLTASFVRIIKLNPSNGGSETTDGTSSINGSDTVSPGKTYAVDVNYSASEDRDIIVELKQDKAPFTTYGVTQVAVSEGSGTVSIDVAIDSNIPLAIDEYKWIAYIFPKGGGFNNNLGLIQEINVDCVAEGDSNLEDITTKSWRIENKATNQWISPLCRFVFDESVPLVVSANDNTGACTKFNFISSNKGYYFIENEYTKGRYRPKGCSTISDDSIDIVQVSNEASGWCVQWKLIDVGNGYFRIQNRQTGSWFRSNSCSATEGTIIKQVSTDYVGDCTMWKLIDAGNNAKVANTTSEMSKTLEKEISFYPNPANNELMLRVNSSLKNVKSIKIYDLQGRVAREVSTDKIRQGTETAIDVSDIGDGLYILSIDFTTRESHNSRFIIKH